MNAKTRWEGDGSIAVRHADAALDRCSATEERYEDHKRDCHIIICDTCIELDRRAEDAWDAYQVARGVCW